MTKIEGNNLKDYYIPITQSLLGSVSVGGSAVDPKMKSKYKVVITLIDKTYTALYYRHCSKDFTHKGKQSRTHQEMGNSNGVLKDE